MRVVAGAFKGRRLNAPKNNTIRPTTDKVKEAVFSMISGYIQDAIVIDLFSGTGSLGLEAISRGAKKCYFGDHAKESLMLIKENVQHCKADDQSVIISGEYEKVLASIPEKADIIFLDPPYQKGMILNCLSQIVQRASLREDGIIVVEHGKDEILPETIRSLGLLKEKKYGKTLISIYG